MPALLFGSISSVVDTSERQRAAFNRAFAEHGLDWSWDLEEYRGLLQSAGGRDRVAQYAADRGQDVDADAVHATKSKLFQQDLAAAELEARPGVLESIARVREAGIPVGFVTTTARENVDALIEGLARGGADVSASTFAVVLDRDDVARPKPDAAVYTTALERLGEQSGLCVAVEDNPDGVTAALAAGLTCLAFPNENTAGSSFPAEARHVDRLDPDQIVPLLRGA